MERWSQTDNDYLCPMARIKLDIPDILPFHRDPGKGHRPELWQPPGQ